MRETANSPDPDALPDPEGAKISERAMARPRLNKLSLIETAGFPDYALVDSGYGRKLERFGTFTVDRPEPQALWRQVLPPEAWLRADAAFKSEKGDEEADGGSWRYVRDVPKTWPIEVMGVTMLCRLMSFRHLGIFPEQVPHWQWMLERIREVKGERPRVLNLFAYTGAASLIAAKAGAEVTHVDASKKAIQWAKENQAASKLQDAPIRWILDDARKFVAREVRRGKTYHVILVDPPKFGRGPEGEVWDLFADSPALLKRLRPASRPEIRQSRSQRICHTGVGARLRSALPRRAPRARRHVRQRRTRHSRREGPARRADVALYPMAGMTREPKQITSLTNERVKAIRALDMRKERKETGCSSPRARRSSSRLATRGSCPRHWSTGPGSGENGIARQYVQWALGRGVEVLEVSEPVLAKLASKENPQSMLGVFKQRFAEPPLPRTVAKEACWLVLEEVRDPGNLGTIIRTVDAVGAAGIILVGNSCDPYSRECVRATMGSVFAVPLVRMDREAFLAWRAGWPGDVAGLHLEADEDFRHAKLKGPVLLVMGSEGPGLSESLTRSCSRLVKIPMAGKLDSLNLAVATALALYQVRGAYLGNRQPAAGSGQYSIQQTGLPSRCSGIL